jgi:hypothetical protein
MKETGNRHYQEKRWKIHTFEDRPGGKMIVEQITLIMNLRLIVTFTLLLAMSALSLFSPVQ